jgi:Flp pilus assembly protein TadD
LPAVADSFAYRILGGGAQRLAAIARIDSAGWEPLRSELERSAVESPWSSRAHAVLASMALAQGRAAEARDHLERVLQADPTNAQARTLLESLAKKGE